MAAANPGLEAAIHADPENEQAYLVYADWLQQQGDPRGELAVVQAGIAADPTRRELWLRQHQLLVAHRRQLLGELPEPADPVADGAAFRCTWRGGWMVGAQIASFMEESVERLYPALVGCESTRFLTELTIGRASSYAAFAAAVAERGMPWRLRELTYAEDRFRGDQPDLGDVGVFLRHTRELRILRLSGVQLQLDEVDLPELQGLAVGLLRSHPALVEVLAAAHWPRLEFISLQIGPSDGDDQPRQYVPLLRSQGFPALETLSLRHNPFLDGLVDELAASPILPGLRRLDLRYGGLTDAGLRRLVERRESFAALELLDLGTNIKLSDEGKRLARTLPCKVEL